jgi:hypothetical protein
MGDESKLNKMFFIPDEDQTDVYKKLLDDVRLYVPTLKKANDLISQNQTVGGDMTIDDFEQILRKAIALTPKDKRNNSTDADSSSHANRQTDPRARGVQAGVNTKEYPIFARRPPDTTTKKDCCDAIVLEVGTAGRTFGRQCRRPASLTSVNAATKGLCKQHQCTPGQRRYDNLPGSFGYVGNGNLQPDPKKTQIQTMFSNAVELLVDNAGKDTNSIKLVKKFLQDHNAKVQMAHNEQVRIGISQMIQASEDRPNIMKEVRAVIESDTDIELCTEGE